LFQRLKFDLRNAKILSRRLKEVDLFEDFHDRDLALDECWVPASGTLPDFDINEDPDAYIRQRLAVVKQPELPPYKVHGYYGDSSSEDSEEEVGDE
jgi:hypothetical protein